MSEKFIQIDWGYIFRKLSSCIKFIIIADLALFTLALFLEITSEINHDFKLIIVCGILITVLTIGLSKFFKQEIIYLILFSLIGLLLIYNISSNIYVNHFKKSNQNNTEVKNSIDSFKNNERKNQDSLLKIAPTQEVDEQINYQRIGLDTFKIWYMDVDSGFIYLPSRLVEFSVYEQKNGNSPKPEDMGLLIDIDGSEASGLDRHHFLSNLGRYIQIANSRKSRCIISAKDSINNDWMGNHKIKFGKTKILKGLRETKPYIEAFEKASGMKGWINYLDVP